MRMAFVSHSPKKQSVAVMCYYTLGCKNASLYFGL